MSDKATASSHGGPLNLKRSCKLGMLRNDVQLTLPALIQVSLIQLTPLFDGYVSGFEEVLIEPQFAMVGILLAFAAVHSGLAFLRPYGGALHRDVLLLLTTVKCLFIMHLTPLCGAYVEPFMHCLLAYIAYCASN
jgi:hypothetical protein